MDIVFNIFLALHITCGSVGLLAGFVNMLRKKGDSNHKFIGKVFLVAMLTAGISSLLLACIHPNSFLFMTGVFTLYMVGSGQLYLKKQIAWPITLLMLLAGILFIGLGVSNLVKANWFGLVYVTYGSLGLLFVRQDFKNHNEQSAIKNYWLVGHIQRMTGGFIAALTAFLVVNAKYFPQQIPGFAYWLLPVAIMMPLIIIWSRKYEARKYTQH